MKEVADPNVAKRIRFSAVIPTYNRGRLIERAIESALEQNHSPFEVIVVDDGSVDDTKQRLLRFGDRIRYIYQNNAGSAMARNRGVSKANSDYIAFLDSDDIWQTDHLLRMARAIVGTAGQANYYFADILEPEERGGVLLWSKIDFSIDEPYRLFLDGTELVLVDGLQPMMLQSTVIKKAALLECGGFRKELRYRDDTHLFLKLGIGQPICAVSGCGAIATSDDLPENRLTLNYDHSEAGTYMFTIMYDDLLTTVDDMPTEARNELRRRLGGALRQMASRSWEKDDYSSAAYYLARAAKVDPNGLFQKLWERTGRYEKSSRLR